MYLYIFEDGSMLQSQNPPTPTDLEAIDEGTLIIVSQVGAKFVELDACGDMTDLPEAVQQDGYTMAKHEATHDS